MNFSTHLTRINNTRGNGTKLGYWYLTCSYVLNYFINRPALVRLTRRSRYQQEKKLLYTVVTGGYDQLNEIPKKLHNWDFICFTDNPDLKSDTWQIRELENKLNLEPFRLSRHYKINNHLVDSEYDLSVYIDCNYRIRGDLDTFVSHILPIGKQIGMLLHPFHSSLAEEVELCVTNNKDDEEMLRSQYRYYVEEKQFRDSFPHIAGGMIIRRSGDPTIKKLMETWFSQLMRWSRRDQMAFNYSLAKHPEIFPHYIPYWILRRYFKKMDHVR
jgi:hypothetical protein